MTTSETTTTPTVEMTLADNYRIAADLIARDDINLFSVSVNAYQTPWAVDFQCADGAVTLRVVWDLLDDPSVKVHEVDQSTSRTSAIHVAVQGHYRGVGMYFYKGFHAPADLDLIRAFVVDNQLNDARLLDALVGDKPKENQR